MKEKIWKFYHIQGDTHYVGGITPKGFILNTLLIISGTLTFSILFL